MRRLPRRPARGLLLALVALGAFGAPPSPAAGLAISDAWTRPTPPGVEVAVGYLAIDNGGGADVLVGASSPLARRVEFHESRTEGGLSRMRELESVPVPAGSRLVFAPGALHLMLVGLARPLKLGERVPVTLVFEHSGVREVVLAAGEGAPVLAPLPQRLVTLAPHLTELVYAAGAGERLVGTLNTSDYPPAALRVERIGDVTHLDAERLLALKPDLVLLWGDGSPAEQHALLKHLGLPVLSLEQHRLGDVADTLEQLGRVFGTEAVAHAAAARLRAELAALAARYEHERKLRVFYQVWSTPLYTLGGRHVASEMLRICGAENVFDAEDRSSFMVDQESVYARDPDAIALAGTPAETKAWRARWGAGTPLRAIAMGAVFTLDPDLTNRMGPRIGAGTAALCERLAEVRAHALRR